MKRLLGRISGFITNRTTVGTDKSGNRYFTRNEEVDGIMKEKRWVVFKGEEDPTSIPVEWICWLNGQRKRAPTPEEMVDLDARRERVKQNVALLKKEEEERRAKEGSTGKRVSTGKTSGPDLKSFIRQVGAPAPTEGDEIEESSGTTGGLRDSHEKEALKEKEPESSEPMGSGASFRPGTWQPPS
ncbi:unnamed protein product [Lupinus luteus]|uniref:NADH dehydrogenase [ubiquinone] 1 alpha subcomplex subunit 12 n=1 Tax=Lupinus luteus TaxID=3873 RepID=A0AAV1WLI6_LUPLU